jgi:hypothetical protein
VGGTWLITFTNMMGAGVSCSITPIEFRFVQNTEEQFTADGGQTTLSCNAGTGGIQDKTYTGTGRLAGTISGNSMTASQEFLGAIHLTGTVSGNLMTGSVRWHEFVFGVSVTLNGQFEGTRQ